MPLYHPKPWDRLPGESPQAYRAALIYFGLGPGRTLNHASQVFDEERAEYEGPSNRKRRKPSTTRPSGTINRWSAQWGWKERAAAWDAEQIRMERDAEERQRRKDAVEWSRRFARSVKDNWDIAQQLKVRALEMLNHPIVQTTGGTEGNPTVTEPTRWTAADIPRYLRSVAALEEMVMRAVLPSTDPGPSSQNEGNGTPPPPAGPTVVRVNLTAPPPPPPPEKPEDGGDDQ